MNYWKECIREAFDDSKIDATEEQIDNVTGWVEGAYENYGLATGNDVASANFVSDADRELEGLKKELEKKRLWELKTQPCRACMTTGVTRDGWGRDQTCYSCDGKGRV